MKRIALVVVVLVLGAVAVPPLYFAVFPPELAALPPAGERIPVADGVQVNALVRGDGPVAVLVHGLPGSAYDWAPLTEALVERGMRVIAYDRVGYGRSDARTNGQFTIEGSARDLVALLDSAQLVDATVVGWSYGGATAVQAALDDPARIGRLVLVGTGGPLEDPPEPPLFVRVIFSKPVLRWISAVPPVGRGVQRSITEQAFSGQPYPGWWLPTLAANFDAPHTRATYAAEGEGYAPDGLDPAPIQRPILLLHGDADRLAPLAIAEGLHARAVGSELDVVEGGSHMLPVTHATYLANRIANFAGVR